MNVPLPVFVAAPLVAAFVLPAFGARLKSAGTFLANVVVLALLGLSVLLLGQTQVYEVGGWSVPLGINLVLDGFSALMLVAVAVVSTAAMLFSIRYMEQYTAKTKYLSLFLLMVAGMNGVVLSGDVFNLYVFLEIASIASYALVGFGCDHEELEASFKYMVLGSIASVFILFGVALVYGNTGSLNMAYIARAIQEAGMNSGLALALSLFVAGFGLKAALVPFHAWLPDAHPSAPAPISAMLSGVLIKALGVYALSRLIFNVFGVSVPIAWVLIALGVLSMVIGVFLAVGQWDFKRLLAYHSISQMGYVVLGLGIGALILARDGNRMWASLAILGGLFHLANHAVFKSLLFLTSGSVEMATGTRQLKQMGGLVERMPLTRAASAVASASIAGVPPFNGFWSKLILVIAAVQARLFVIAAVTVLVSLVTLLSFLKVQRYVFLGELPDNLRGARESKGSMLLAMGFLAVLCLAMSLLVLLPGLRETVLQPAVDVLLAGVGYSVTLVKL
ncbi:complex I subunit 5 family protein [Anaerobaca lacustris]|uniref:Proton-conducting transporter membrane subunit n=1 Tax=Anaerobaca lacustris TaxID=3044600 RepID=A0AAW6U0X6_9BACT|nr:proton-conducting transporter membrane subunit [Sedimentisphaerales bacterium M17dextr]